jgi:uncharacterized protein with PIN domain
MKCKIHDELERFKRAVDVALLEMKLCRARLSMTVASIELQKSIDAHSKECINCQRVLTRPGQTEHTPV